MNILDFLRKKIIKSEESPEDKIKKDLLSRIYNRAFLFYGDSDRTIEINGETITYTHSECFLADSKYPSLIKKFIRLTGDNLNGTPVSVTKDEFWSYGEYSGTIFHIVENGAEYSISSNSCLDESWLNDHSISGYGVVKATDRYNSIKINQQLEEVTEQKSIDELFEE